MTPSATNGETNAGDALKAYREAQAASPKTHLAPEAGATEGENSGEFPAGKDTMSKDAMSGKEHQSVNSGLFNETDSANPGAAENREADGPSVLEADLVCAQEARIAELSEELARANASYYNKDQEFAAYVRRSKAEIPLYRQTGVEDVVGALMGVLDDLALARQHGDLTGPFATVADKIEGTLEAKFQVKRYGKPGEAFDPNLHQAIQMMGEENDNPVIVQLAQPGYLLGEKVLRPAMVIVGPGGPQH